MTSDASFLMLEFVGYSPNCGKIWHSGWNYNIVPAKFRERDVWRFEQSGRACVAPYVDNDSCRVTDCGRWSDSEEQGAAFGYLVKDFELAKEIFATRPNYDNSWVTDTWE